ncbi:MAG: BCCT family transporter, partial [Lachnospiraceae bacterium]|nr:BCCT family transporter [Lachnospiraceae bacterium]
MNRQESLKDKIDWTTVVVPFALIAFLCAGFIFVPEQSSNIIAQIRFLLGDTLGLYYLIIGLGVFLLSIYLAFSKYGSIRLGRPDEKPKYKDFTWASMMFTAGLAADILFYSFCEWILYASDPHLASLGSMQIWSSTYPLFHWGPIPWSFYLVLAVAFGFMIHVRGCHKQKYSEACRPILGDKVDKLPGKCIDL